MTAINAAQSAINAAFQASYGRPPTSQELTYWSNNLMAGEAVSTADAVISADAAAGISSVPSGVSTASVSAVAVSPPSTALDNTVYINFLYLYFFKRLPEPSEVTFYLNAIANGTTQAQIFGYFTASPENQVIVTTLTATATDVANRLTIRDATGVSGGTAGFVNSAQRDVDNVGANDTSFEWAHTDIVNSAAGAGTENVATYSQANGTGTGEIWGSVSQVTQNLDAPAIGIEIDVKKATGIADGIAIDMVNEGGETTEMQGGDGEIIWRDRTYNGKNGQSLSCIKSVAGGGFEIWVRGAVAASWY